MSVLGFVDSIWPVCAYKLVLHWPKRYIAVERAGNPMRATVSIRTLVGAEKMISIKVVADANGLLDGKKG